MNYTQKDYYTEMTHAEFYDLIDNKMIDFNLRYINRLKTLSVKFEIFKHNDKNYIHYNELNIIECEDEWFVVDYFIKGFYKCDQIDGLIYCLKDKGFI